MPTFLASQRSVCVCVSLANFPQLWIIKLDRGGSDLSVSVVCDAEFSIQALNRISNALTPVLSILVTWITSKLNLVKRADGVDFTSAYRCQTFFVDFTGKPYLIYKKLARNISPLIMIDRQCNLSRLIMIYTPYLCMAVSVHVYTVFLSSGYWTIP